MIGPGRPLDDQRGFALFTTVLALLLLVTLGVMSLMISNLELRSTSHYRTGNQAFFTAESGLLHALSTINARGVQNFQNDIANSTNWARLYGSAVKTMPDGSTYQVVVTTDSTNPASGGFITGFGFANLEARRILRIKLRKGGNGDIGALYMAADTVDPDFGARDQFLIDGNDHKMNLTANPGGPVKAGIATRNDTVTQDAIDELSDPQEERVRGLDFSLSPLKPSVVTTGGPSVTDLEQVVNYILNNNPVTTDNGHNFADATFGSLASPRVTHLTDNNVLMNGSMTGAGILIADGSVTINGSANFIGWIIVRGDTIVDSLKVDDTEVDGNATIVGSLWTGDLKVHVGGSAIVAYCQECMELANNTGYGNNAPKLMSVVSWQEII